MLSPLPVRLLEEGEPAITTQLEEPLPALYSEGGKEYRLEQKMGPESPDAPTAIYRFTGNYIPSEQNAVEVKQLVPDGPTETTPRVENLDKHMAHPPIGTIQTELAEDEQKRKEAAAKDGEPTVWTAQTDLDDEGNPVNRDEPLPGDPTEHRDPTWSEVDPRDGILPESTVDALIEQNQWDIDQEIERGQTKVVESDEDRTPPGVELETAGEDIDDASIPYTEAEAAELMDDDEVADPDDDDDLQQYYRGGGWYEINGESYHGKTAAMEALTK